MSETDWKSHILGRFTGGRMGVSPPQVAVLRLSGVIGGGRFRPHGSAINLEALAGPIERAFSLRGVKAVALAVNSPGGSPVQSSLIHKRIRALAAEKEVPVYAFAEDVAASGGYWLLCAGDEIYADANSIVGSIGVISAGFGFTELIAKIGVERRAHAQGDHKLMLDPFAPEKDEDVARLSELQKDMHESFKALVRESRGDKLAKRKLKEIFSGDIWTGQRAQALGLIDGLGDLRSVMRQKFGDDVKLRVVGGGKPWWRRRFGLSENRFTGGWAGTFADTFADTWADRLITAVEDRLLWSRFRL
jgi:signal peptide peptidase SppA